MKLLNKLAIIMVTALSLFASSNLLADCSTCGYYGTCDSCTWGGGGYITACPMCENTCSACEPTYRSCTCGVSSPCACNYGDYSY